MLNSNLVKKAHQMTRNIKAEYKEVDYKLQFGLCLSYLLNGGDIMKKINFTKKDHEFEFANFTWKNENLYADWKVIGEYENNKSSQGYFYNSKYLKDKNAFTTDGFKVGKKKMAGVILPENIDVNLLIKEAKEKKAKEIQERAERLDKIYTDDFVLDLSYNTSYGFSLGDYKDSTRGKSIKKKLKKRNVEGKINAALKEYQTEVDWGDYTITNDFKVPILEFEKIVNNISDEVESAKKAKEEKNEAERNAIFDKAKETGEKQVLHRWSAPCNCPDEECNVDIIIVYAMPDGTTTKTRNHTW